MKVVQINFHGDHNLGLFCKTSDKFCLIGNFILEKSRQQIEDIMKVKTVKLTMANTDLCGVFCCMNSNGILISNIISETEAEKFNILKKELDINLQILKTKFTAIGNLILCNDKGAVISKVFPKKDMKKIADCLDVESECLTVASMNNVGSCGVATNEGCLLHRDADEDEIKKIESVLKVSVDIGTANFGSPFVGSCCFANSNGSVVGQSTTGPEVTRILEALNLL